MVMDADRVSNEYQCHKDHALVVCDHVDGRIRFSGFVLAGFISSENVDFPYFGGPWIVSITVKRPVARYIISSEYITLLGLGPCGFPSFWISTSNAKFCSM